MREKKRKEIGTEKRCKEKDMKLRIAKYCRKGKVGSNKLLREKCFIYRVQTFE